MPARLAYPFVYEAITAGLDDDKRIKVDALLGDPDAIAYVNNSRREAVAGAGGRIH